MWVRLSSCSNFFPPASSRAPHGQGTEQLCVAGRAMVDPKSSEADLDLAQGALTCASTRDALTRRLWPRVRRLVASFLRGSADADDAAQQALMEILRAMPGFRGEARLESWADRIAVRTAI